MSLLKLTNDHLKNGVIHFTCDQSESVLDPVNKFYSKLDFDFYYGPMSNCNCTIVNNVVSVQAKEPIPIIIHSFGCPRAFKIKESVSLMNDENRLQFVSTLIKNGFMTLLTVSSMYILGNIV